MNRIIYMILDGGNQGVRRLRLGVFKNVLDAAVPLSAFSPAISAENDPGFFVLFLKSDISCKNPDKSAAILYRADAIQTEPTCFSKSSHLFVTVKECCP